MSAEARVNLSSPHAKLVQSVMKCLAIGALCLVALGVAGAGSAFGAGLGPSPTVACPPPQICNPPHTPPPTSPATHPAVVENGLSSMRSSNGTNLVLTQGQTGSLSFYCVLNPGMYQCTPNITATWTVSSLPGFNISLNPSSTTGTNPVTVTITASTIVTPGTYADEVYFQTNTGAQSNLRFLIQVAPGAAVNGAAGPLDQAIYNQAVAFYTAKYDTSAGPACPPRAGNPTGPGSCACAYVVNIILASKGVRPLGVRPDFVPDLEADLQSGRGVLVPFGQAQPGDIVVENSQGHIGICFSQGCGSVISNSSHDHTFTAITGPGIFESTNGRIYRLQN